MPDVTWSRPLPTLSKWEHFNSGTRLGQGVQPLPTGIQTTTSFRSERRSVGPEDVGERDFENHTDFVRALRTEYVHQYDTGHNFDTEKYEILYPTQGITIQQNLSGLPYPNKQYWGYLYPNAPLLGKAALASFVPSNSSLDAFGTKKIAATIPTKPHASLAQFLGELREPFPSITGVQTVLSNNRVRSTGGEYLNVEFGLKPMISDVQKFARSLAIAHELVAELREGSGKNSRVETPWEVETSSSVVLSGSPSTVVIRPWFDSFAYRDFGPNEGYSTTGKASSVRTTSVSRKFVGAWTYHLSEAHSFFGRADAYLRKADYLLGVKLDVDTVYELTPWSWLFNWFVDINSFLTNVVALSNDSLVLRYGYALAETRSEHAIVQTGMIPRSGWVAPTSCSIVERYTRKVRRKCTPYGFGVDLGALSPRRWAILAALGMTKSGNSLR